MLKKTNKFESFNDGVLEFGSYEESYDELNNATDKKEFSIKGRLFFSYKSIREQDRFKYDNTGSKISIKLKTLMSPKLSKSDVVRINGILYSIANLDPDVERKKVYIFLTELKDDMNKHISIFRKNINTSALEDVLWEHLRTVWGDVKEINTAKTLENNYDGRVESKFIKKFIIRYIKYLDLSVDKKASVNYKVAYKNKFYNIIRITNLEEKDEILEVEAEIE